MEHKEQINPKLAQHLGELKEQSFDPFFHTRVMGKLEPDSVVKPSVIRWLLSSYALTAVVLLGFFFFVEQEITVDHFLGIGEYEVETELEMTSFDNLTIFDENEY